jgi:hypothetical protein
MLLALSMIFMYLNSFVAFQPILFDGSEYKTAKVDDQFYRNLKEVLEEENVIYRVEKGKIFIKRYSSYNEEAIYNYTEKALDSNKRGKKIILN